MIAQEAAKQQAAAARKAKARKDGATTVTLYWESASKCGKLNNQPAPCLSGCAEVHGNQLSARLSKGSAKQTTRAVASTSPCWKETMEWKIEDFDKVNPRLCLSMMDGKGKDFMFTEYVAGLAYMRLHGQWQ